ncbi:MAG: AAA family ATPase [Halobacteriovoraceae bacterium]|jgi:flagellar biosynthesis protein FlhG|nr:AAA family ATPase [Halobacteriovoraceae bacterium]MBT5096044.1 AAA family ATPase [Halobacteriovoraceae bacterium]
MSETSARNWLLSQNSYDQPGLSRKLEGRAKTISVTSGKGGVGKTSASLKTSKILAEWGYRVLLVDCDSNLSNTALKLGLPVKNDFMDLVSGRKSFDECIYKDDNFHLLAACNGDLELFEKNIQFDHIIIDLITSYENQYDFIILDCPAGISKEIMALNAYCDYRFVVVTPDKSSLTDSYSLMKILNTRFGVKDYHLLVNKVSSTNQYQRLIKTLCETTENFLDCRLNVLGGIKLEPDSGDRFDQILLEEANNSLHKNFVKLLSNFTEKNIGTQPIRNYACVDDYGQEVRGTIS